MAEGWSAALKSDRIDAYSAGVEPHGLNALAVKAMAEAGVDISSHKSKHVDDLKDIAFDYVVTVCGHANETCPIFPGHAKVVHVGFDDPPALARDATTPEEAMGHYRRVRDEIREFVLTLPASLERTRLAAPRDKHKQGVLVMCVGNTARSQMAEGFIRAMAGDFLDVHSAGMDPGDHIHPLAIEVMAEIGIDISRQWPKSLRAYVGRTWFKYAIMACSESEPRCPRLYIGASHILSWPFEDPAIVTGTPDQQRAAFRRVRDALGEKAAAWVRTLRTLPTPDE